ncbi:MAG: pyridoxamine 5'-phosphate oxidase family protein [Ahrensia sp.]|nr:pyridoxamine 5'-phosphate oxidase family protein [Ahrensia sp.]
MTHLITSIADLEAHYPGVNSIAPATMLKETATITQPYRRLIEAAPFFAVASIGPEGMDCSPRGDGPGTVRILDEHRIAFPDRRGNNRLDTLRNIVGDPRVALLFLIPGWNECLRINGSAMITTEPELLESFAVNSKRPATVVLVTIQTMYFQCARAIKRARLWEPDAQLEPAALPTAGELVKSAMADFDAETYDAQLQDRQAKTLY